MGVKRNFGLVVVAMMANVLFGGTVPVRAQIQAAGSDLWTPTLPTKAGDYSIWFQENDSGGQSNVCGSSDSTDCVAEAWAVIGGTRVEGTSVTVVGHEQKLWTFPGVVHDGGDLFAVQSDPNGVEIIPVRMTDRPFVEGGWERLEAACAQIGGPKCMMRSPFPAGVRFGLTLRSSHDIKGFGLGRMSDIALSTSRFGQSQTLTIEAFPVTVPSVSLAANWASLGPEVQAWFRAHCIDSFKLGVDGECQIGPAGTAFAYPNSVSSAVWSQDPTAMRGFFTDYLGSRTYMAASPAYKALTAMRTAIKDSAASMPGFWAMRIRPPGYNDHSCLYLADGLTGYLATNALVFTRTVPRFDENLRALLLDTASPHFAPDGKTSIVGTYDLGLRSDVADCLYSLSDSFASPSGVYAEEYDYIDGSTFPSRRSDAVETETAEETTVDVAEEELLGVLPADPAGPSDVDSVRGVDVLAAAKVAVVKKVGTKEYVQSPRVETGLANSWFRLRATDFGYSDPVIRSNVAVVPSVVTWCTGSGKLYRAKGLRPGCPSGLVKAAITYCSAGGVVTAIVGAGSGCASGSKKVSRLECARKGVLKPVFAVSPRCDPGFKKLSSIVCVNTKSKTARTVRAVTPRCVNGFVKARVISCVSGARSFKVTAVRPSCPKGSRRA